MLLRDPGCVPVGGRSIKPHFTIIFFIVPVSRLIEKLPKVKEATDKREAYESLYSSERVIAAGPPLPYTLKNVRYSPSRKKEVFLFISL